MAHHPIPVGARPAIRALALAISIVAGAQTLCAEEACPLHDWLAWVYAEGEGLQQLPPGPERQQAALALAGAVAGAGRDRLDRLMGAVGLGEDVDTVASYMAVLRARLMTLDPDAPPSGGPAERPPGAERMGTFLETLTCDADPDWTAPGRVSGPAPRGPRRRNAPDLDLRAAAMATGAVLGTGAAAVAAVALGMALYAAFDRRRSARVPCRMRALLRTPDGPLAGLAVDISRHGAKVRLDTDLIPQTRCTFEAGGLAIPARIMWSNHHFTGIDFVPAIDPAPFGRLLSRHRWDAPAFGPLAPGPTPRPPQPLGTGPED